ncbi:MAG TPA: hypothetical protein VGV15_04510 [Terriglobales bacterium]|nr:hypothetical protein [Terriglobales bacterium]
MRQRTIRRRQERAKKAAEDQPKSRSSTLLFLSGLLLFGTLALYSPVRGHDFVNYDDDDYILKNPHVTDGLTWQAIRWSVTATEQCNWHPVTWLSHALDCQLFGLEAGYHHLTSALIHSLNALLLFLLLQRATGAVKRSFVVAALFACHPLGVDSVAWAAERKNVLSTFFLLLTLGAYGWYARRPRLKSFAAVVGMFALALASKPMVVTLPFVLLLLDYWPLQRVAEWTQQSSSFPVPQRSIWLLLREKLTIFALSIASCALTVWAQKVGDAVRSSQLFPLRARFANALLSYVLYIWKMFWPLKLSAFYPHPGASLAVWKPVAAAALLCAISIAVWLERRSRPYLLVGWLWFLGTLVPVIGVVQVGDQGMADRYTYLPLIGLFLMVVWGISDLFDRLRLGPKLRWAVALGVVGAMSFLTLRQLDYWQDSVTLWTHAFEVTAGNLQVEKQLANAMVRENQHEAVAPHLINIARLDPSDVSNHVNLGASYDSQGRVQDAIQEFQTVIALTDHRELTAEERRCRSGALVNLGSAFVSQGDFPNALMSFQKLNQTDPAEVDQMLESYQRSIAADPTVRLYEKLALLLRAKGKAAEASSLLQDVIHENPGLNDTRALLAYLDASSK